jgi:exodeoxyribonuclease III
MKIATWNVNGIRARYAQLCEWIATDRPDILCLQEIKASPEQVPGLGRELEDYWCTWHGKKGYSGVGLHVRKTLCPTKPTCSHPAFDFENRIARPGSRGSRSLRCTFRTAARIFPRR